MSQCGGWQSCQAVLVGHQEVATGRKSAIKAGRQASDVCGDVGQDTRRGLVVVGDLKQNISGQKWRSKPLQLVITLRSFCSCELLGCRNVLIASVDGELRDPLIWPTLVTVLDSSQIVKPAQSTSPLV